MMRGLSPAVRRRLTLAAVTLLVVDAALVALGEAYLAAHLPLGVPLYAALVGWTAVNVAVVALFGLLVGRALLAQQRGLAESHDRLQAATEQLEVANEELEVANEELQTQAEELESANEELVVTAEDLSRMNAELERRAAELEAASDALAGEHALLEAVLAATPTALAVLEAERKIIAANSAFGELAERKADELLGMAVRELEALPALAAGEVGAAIERALDGRRTVFEKLACEAGGGEGGRGERDPEGTPVKGPDGRRFRLEVLGFQHAGQPAVLLALEDVSERLRLHAREALLAALVAASGEAIVSADAGGRVTSWNPAATRLLGYTEPEMVGRPLLGPVPDQLAGEAAELIASAEREGRATARTHREHASGKLVVVDITVSALRDADGALSGYVAILRDATERQLAAREQQTTAEILAIFARERF